MVGGLAVPISARLPFAASVAYTWLVCLADSRMTNVECNLINCTCENKQLSDILSASGAQIIKAQLPGDDENVLAFSLCGGISVDNAKTVIPGELSPQCEAELSKEAPVMMRVDSGTGHCVLTNSSGRAATATVAVPDSPGGHSAKLEMRFLCEPRFTVTVELAQNVPLDKQICKPIGSPKFVGESDNCLEWDATIGAEGKQLVQCAAPTKIPPAPGPGPDSNTDDSGLTTTQIVAICLSAVEQSNRLLSEPHGLLRLQLRLPAASLHVPAQPPRLEPTTLPLALRLHPQQAVQRAAARFPRRHRHSPAVETKLSPR